MIPHRLQIKYFAADPASVDVAVVVPVFHRWIQQQRLDGLLIDVVDYKHVRHGPGVILIGHEADRALDMGGGRPGFLYRRKRHLPVDLREGVRTALRQVVQGCLLLEADPAVEGRLTFLPTETHLTFLDRLQVPNHARSWERLREEVQGVVADVYGEARVRLSWVDEDPRQPFAVRVEAPEAPDLATLARSLEAYQSHA